MIEHWIPVLQALSVFFGSITGLGALLAALIKARHLSRVTIWFARRVDHVHQIENLTEQLRFVREELAVSDTRATRLDQVATAGNYLGAQVAAIMKRQAETDSTNQRLEKVLVDLVGYCKGLIAHIAVQSAVLVAHQIPVPEGCPELPEQLRTEFDV